MPSKDELTPLSRRNSAPPNQPVDGRPKTQKVLEQVEEVKEIMHNNIDVMMKNHEKVSEIQGKTGTTSLPFIMHDPPLTSPSRNNAEQCLNIQKKCNCCKKSNVVEKLQSMSYLYF
jgi:hypothetical protein